MGHPSVRSWVVGGAMAWTLVGLGACATSVDSGFGGAAGSGASSASGGSGAAPAGGGASVGGSGGAGAGANGGAAGSFGGTTAGTGGGGGTTASGGVGGTTISGGTGGGGAGGFGATGGSGGSTSGGGTGGTAGSGGGGAKGDCCSETQGVPGCAIASVQSCVCAQDPFCCYGEWDAACAGGTLLYKCGTCPTPSDCCTTSKCSSDAVRECVGATTASCATTWSPSCASQMAALGCGSCGTTPPTGSVWINELHYDNASTDSGEGVEIAGSAGTALDGYQLVFYNGNPTSLKKYKTVSLTGAIPAQQSGMGTLWFAVAGIENGGDATPQPDGVALVDKNGKVIQFLSYEGTFVAADGAAMSMTSTDIGKTESATTAAGQSLGLTGAGKKYADFSWSGPATATPGQPNGGQTFN